MIPIGRGQRELIIGDRKTGKTAIAIDTIINQRGGDVICVYVAIGLKESTVVGLVDRLREVGAMDYTIVISASAADPAPLQYIAPYAGAAMAEYFMYRRARPPSASTTTCRSRRRPTASSRCCCAARRAARPTRATCSISTRACWSAASSCARSTRWCRRTRPRTAATARWSVKHAQGLEAPEDQRPDDVNGVFHRPHGRHKAEAFLATLPDADKYRVHRFPDTGGSMTALPIIETLEGEVSAYIPTNVISITDGQIYLEPDLFFAGVRPAINVGISVSRVGGNAQRKAMKKVSGSLRLDLAAFRELEAFAQLGTELDASSQRQLDRGQRMVELLKQPQYQPFNVNEEVLSIFAGTRGFLDDVPVREVARFETAMLKYFRDQHPEIVDELDRTKDLSNDLAEKIGKAIRDFKSQHNKAAAPKGREVAA